MSIATFTDSEAMPNPFTIRIFVPDGDPEGVRIIDRMNWTGLGIVFPREKWQDTRGRVEFDRTGVYILVGYQQRETDELPMLYIGQADGVRTRIDAHDKQKEFWNWGIAFVSTNNGLNRAHVTWLEYALIQRAIAAKRSHLDNGNSPQEPALSESERADTQGFLSEILQILPVVGLRAFEQPKAVAKHRVMIHSP
ncbi:MAG: GIY-YIG nuclease family protein [Myxacorys californica WJT36-NPBG1]|nr:GIY-YIG nuclease family protein [Myxacorys californica WJT36-NPBG1]